MVQFLPWMDDGIFQSIYGRCKFIQYRRSNMVTVWGSSKGGGLRLDTLVRVDSLVGVGDGMKCKLGGGGGW